MTNEADALSQWKLDRPAYEAWGNLLTQQISEALSRATLEDIGSYLKVPATPRLKTEDSFRVKVQRKLANGEALDSIDDRVGVRFVVLLATQIRVVEQVIKDLGHEFSVDRDYEDERLDRPLEFAYQSVHLVVRPKNEIEFEGVTIPHGIACEVQIRTLLQHAHSELTHDRVYKARKAPPNQLNRSVARSMALIEATDEIFGQVADDLERDESKLREAASALDALYLDLIQVPAELPNFSASIIAELLECQLSEIEEKTRAFFGSKPYLIGRIRERRSSQNAVYRTSAILMAYVCVSEVVDVVRSIWPLTIHELEEICADLGIGS